jgi:hypothetical protein
VGVCGRRGRDDGSVRGIIDEEKSIKCAWIRKKMSARQREKNRRSRMTPSALAYLACVRVRVCSGVHAHRGGEGGGAKRESEEAKHGNAAHGLYVSSQEDPTGAVFLSWETMRPMDHRGCAVRGRPLELKAPSEELLG